MTTEPRQPREPRREYTPLERSQAKALMIMTGGPLSGARVLDEVWEGRKPSVRTLEAWWYDSRIKPDEQIITALRAQMNAKVVARSGTIVDKLGDRIEREVETAEPLDIQRLVSAFVALSELLGAGPGAGVNVHVGPDAPGGGVLIMPFRARPVEPPPALPAIEASVS
mgnify:CR=1 FL=1